MSVSERIAYLTTQAEAHAEFAANLRDTAAGMPRSEKQTEMLNRANERVASHNVLQRQIAMLEALIAPVEVDA